MTSGSNTNTAGRLLTTLDSSAATAAMPEQRRQRVAVREHVAHGTVKTVEHDRGDDHTQTQHERQEWHVQRVRDP